MKINTSFNYIEKYTLLALIVWTSIFVFSYITNINNEKETIHQLAVNEIRSNFHDIDTFRKWISSHGGIYVPISEKIVPNPTLEHFLGRDIETTTGKQLTLINTPYLLKQLSSNEPLRFNAHMTGLNPINQANRPDEWKQVR